MEEHHDFGYGLRKEFWHRGIASEAGKAVVEQVKKDGLPYITATHDRNNPRSGNVMQARGINTATRMRNCGNLRIFGRIQNVSTELYKRAGLDIPKILGGTS